MNSKKSIRKNIKSLLEEKEEKSNSNSWVIAIFLLASGIVIGGALQDIWINLFN